MGRSMGRLERGTKPDLALIYSSSADAGTRTVGSQRAKHRGMLWFRDVIVTSAICRATATATDEVEEGRALWPGIAACADCFNENMEAVLCFRFPFGAAARHYIELSMLVRDSNKGLDRFWWRRLIGGRWRLPGRARFLEWRSEVLPKI